jgi:sirohydrochlorin ferrochelatase
MTEASEHVFKDAGSWWFETEDESSLGPFDSVDAADDAFKAYCREHLGGASRVIDKAAADTMSSFGREMGELRRTIETQAGALLADEDLLREAKERAKKAEAETKELRDDLAAMTARAEKAEAECVSPLVSSSDRRDTPT